MMNTKKRALLRPLIRLEMKPHLVFLGFFSISFFFLAWYMWQIYSSYLREVIGSPATYPTSGSIMEGRWLGGLNGGILSALVGGVIMATVRRFLFTQEKRARIMEALPYTRATRSRVSLLVGASVILIPCLVAMIMVTWLFAPMIKDISSYAIASPFYAQIAAQNSLAIPTTLLMRYGILALGFFFLTECVLACFGNVLAGVCFGGVCVFTAAQCYIGLAYSPLKRLLPILEGSHHFINYQILSIVPISDGFALWHTGLEAFLLCHGAALCVIVTLTHALHKRIKIEKLTSVFPFRLSRVLVVVVFGLLVMGLAISGILPQTYEYNAERFSVNVWLLLAATVVIAVFAWFMLAKPAKKDKRKKIIALCLAALATISMPYMLQADNILYLNFPSRAQDGDLYSTMMGFPEGISAAPAVNYAAFAVDGETLRKQIAFLEAADALTYKNDSFRNHYGGEDDVSVYANVDAMKQLADHPDSFSYDDYEQLLSNRYEIVSVSDLNPASPIAASLVTLLETHGYSDAAASLEDMLSTVKTQDPIPASEFDTNTYSISTCIRSYADGAIGFAAIAYCTREGFQDISLSISLPLPVTIAGTEDIEAAFAPLPRWYKTSAFHNGEAAYLHYSYLDNKNYFYYPRDMDVSLIVQDGKLTHITFDGYQMQTEAIDTLLSALLKDNPAIAKEAKALYQENRNGSAAIGGAEITVTYPGPGRKYFAITLP